MYIYLLKCLYITQAIIKVIDVSVFLWNEQQKVLNCLLQVLCRQAIVTVLIYFVEAIAEYHNQISAVSTVGARRSTQEHAGARRRPLKGLQLQV